MGVLNAEAGNSEMGGRSVGEIAEKVVPSVTKEIDQSVT